MTRPVLGIDIGGVIRDGMGGDVELENPEQERHVPEMPGAVEAIARLVEVFDGRVWIVSKARLTTQPVLRDWLEFRRFFHRTGVAPAMLRFCLERRDKAPICADAHISHFVDDREDVLEHMIGIVGHRYLFNRNWPETESTIMATLAQWARGNLSEAAAPSPGPRRK